MPFHTGVFGNGTIYLTPPARVPDGTRAYVYILDPHEDPISFYRRLVLLEPQDARLYNQLGLAQLQAGRVADAEASLGRAVQLDYGFAEGHLNLGRCYEMQGQLDSAAAAYRAAAELDPELAAAHRQLVVLLTRLGQPEHALAALTTALAAVPALRTWAEEDDALAALRAGPGWPAA